MGLLNVVNIGVVFEPICFHKKENAMNFVGIDLHKQTISVCVVSQERKVSARQRFLCRQPDRIRARCASSPRALKQEYRADAVDGTAQATTPKRTRTARTAHGDRRDSTGTAAEPNCGLGLTTR